MPSLFRHTWRKRQLAIISAEAIYEPNYETGKAVRWKIESASDEPLGISGIWECRSNGLEGQPLILFSMLIINADDHPLMKYFHRPEDEKRMVVILRLGEYMSSMQAPAEQLSSFLQPYPADALRAEPASKPSASRSRTLAAPSSLF